jgi:hypothetical protein
MEKSGLGIELMNIPTGGDAFNEVTANWSLKLKRPLIAGLRFTTSQLNDVLIELIRKEYGKI